MDVKEAVQKVKDKYEGWQGQARSQEEVDELGKERDKVIALLKRGEAYEKMWEVDAKDWLGNDLDLEEWMNETKQKYFPKEAKQDEADNR